MPAGRRDDAAQRAARRRRAPARRAAGRAAAARAVRRADRARRGRAHARAPRVLSGAVLLGTGRARPDRASPSCCRATARSCRSPPTPTGCCSPPRCCPTGLPRCSACSPSCSPSATYPADRVEGERDRVAERIAIARSQPGVIARTALAARRYGAHPYAVQLPDPELVARGRAPPRCASLHRERVLPAGSSLVLVGDLDPAGGHRRRRPRRWPAGRGVAPAVARRRRCRCCRPDAAAGRPARRGAVQHPARRSGARAAPIPTCPPSGWPTWSSAATSPPGWWRTSASAAATPTARAARSTTWPPASSFLVEADVATEVTGPALLETWYELGRMALLPVTEAELDAARRYVLGSMALATATHAGLASTLSALVGAGLPAGLAGRAPARPGRGDRRRGAGRRPPATWRPPALTAVVVGDAARVADAAAALGPVEVAPTGRRSMSVRGGSTRGQPAARPGDRPWPEGTPATTGGVPGALPLRARPRPTWPAPLRRPGRRPAGPRADRRRAARRAGARGRRPGPRLVWDEQPALPAGRGLPRRGRRRALRRRARRAGADRQRPPRRHLDRAARGRRRPRRPRRRACSPRRSASSSGTSATGSARCPARATTIERAGWVQRDPITGARALPAHRPRGDHARARRRATGACSAARRSGRRGGSRSWPASSSRGSPPRPPSPARSPRRSACGSPTSATSPASPGRSRSR